MASYGRNIAVNIWWWRRDRYNESSMHCAAAETGFDVPTADPTAESATASSAEAPATEAGQPPSPPPVSLANCTLGYNGPPQQLSMKEARKKRTRTSTKCDGLEHLVHTDTEVRTCTAHSCSLPL